MFAFRKSFTLLPLLDCNLTDNSAVAIFLLPVTSNHYPAAASSGVVTRMKLNEII
jgi:hypothetical protein